eukprot:CAMPEP_0182812190 /NCGR_PEP_ID=MMETSP0006_2-20121128/8675_1 /TAXON_ID=97485 /ORGANISM="Prymnesium parvum, Strain Texoma1" /LENGTH=309 /DNA_ID=CAMNT_0024938205 /DNA_START=187 /DNA_END=1113 /DNA_ORIENTATION=+
MTAQHEEEPDDTSTDESDSVLSEDSDSEEENQLFLHSACLLHRRRIVLALLSKSLFTLISGNSGKRREEPFDWARHVARLIPAEFKARYRLPASAFYDLIDILRPSLMQKQEHYVILSRGSPIALETMLAVALRFLAGGQILDIRLIYRMSKPHCYQCVWRVVDAVNSHLVIEFPIDDLGRLKQLEAQFRARSRMQAWSGQVGAIDGVHFAMEKPGASCCQDALRYYVARKDEYALLCIAICDIERRFLYYDISMASTTHDSLAFASSSLGRRIMNGDLPSPFFLNGDNAFVFSESMMIPSGEAALDDF